MVKLKRILKDYEESGALHALVGVHAAVDDHTFLTKSGSLLTVLRARGVDHECLDAEQLHHIARRVEGALRAFDEGFRVYQYQLKRRYPEIPHVTPTNPIVRAAVASRVDYLQAQDLYSVEIYWVVAYEGWGPRAGFRHRVGEFLAEPLAFVRSAFSNDHRIGVLTKGLDRARERLTHRVERLVVELQDVIGLDLLDKRAAFRFLHRLLNCAPYKNAAAQLRYDQFVDFQLCGSALECHRDHLRLDDYFVQVLTLKEAPATTRAGLLSSLQGISSEFLIVTEWRKAANDMVRGEIRSKRRHFHNSRASMLNYLDSSPPARQDMLIDHAATALADDLGECLEQIEVHGRSFGEWSLTIVLYDEDRANLSRSVAECFKTCAALDITLTEERYNILNAFLATVPGNQAFNLRRMWLLSTNHADLSPLFTPHSGESVNATLGTEYLAALETDSRTPYFFNLHHQDIAHTLILGASGSGKSFFLSFLLTHLQKYEPCTFIFDLGGSYESVTRVFGGAYVAVNLQRPFSINPFQLPPTAENHRFLLSFLRVLAESGGYRLTARDERDLHEQIENLYAVEPSQRRLYTLVNILNRTLREHLQRWVEGGPYGFLFDNVEDNLTFSRFQTFDFEGMDKNPQILEPLLFYILHRANAAIHDPAISTTFKVFAIDEAWRFLRHSAIKSYVQEGFKTWRKKNAAVILATQSSDDLLSSELLPVVVESCPTKLFLSNPGIDVSSYRETFHLNQTEANLVAGLVPKRQILLKRPDQSKVLNLNVGAKDYWLYTNNPFDNKKRQEAFDRYGFEEALEILARSPSP
jgi:type IV secretion system protein VirB4